MLRLDEIQQKSQWLLVPIIVAFFAVFLPLSSLGYLAVKVIICGSAIYALREARQISGVALLSLISVAILFNPVIPVYLRDRLLWIVADLFAIFVFFSRMNFKRYSAQELRDIQQSPDLQLGSIPASEDSSTVIEGSYVNPVMIAQLRALIANNHYVQEIEGRDKRRLRSFLGYCSGFFLFNRDPKRAVYFLSAGMWVKESFWPKICSELSAHLGEVCSEKQISILSPLISEEIIFDESWYEGYEKGICDAKLWADGKVVGRSLDDI